MSDQNAALVRRRNAPPPPSARPIHSQDSSLRYSLLTASLLLALIVGNFFAARMCHPNHRLRWYLAARRPLRANQLLRDDDVRPRLGWLPDDCPEVLPGGSAVTGQFASVPLSVNACVGQDVVSPVPIRTDPTATVVMPIRVRADSIPGLNPGTFIGLAPGADLVPPAEPHWVAGPFMLLAILPTSNDQATLLLSLPPSALASMPPDITSKVWVPVQLPTNAATTLPTTRASSSPATTLPATTLPAATLPATTP